MKKTISILIVLAAGYAFADDILLSIIRKRLIVEEPPAEPGFYPDLSITEPASSSGFDSYEPSVTNTVPDGSAPVLYDWTKSGGYIFATGSGL